MGEVMPLTPEDVSTKRFTPVRLREGYDMGEVDAFLDEVEAELERLIKENDDLRSKLGATDGGTSAIAMPGKAPEKAPETAADKAPEKAAEPTPEKAPEAEKVEDKPAEKVAEPAAERPVAAAASATEEIKVYTAAEASSAATRLLELATRNADEVVTEAIQEAEQIVGAARTEAERLEAETKSRAEKLEAETKSKADKLEQEARNRAQNLDSEVESKRREMLGDLEREKRRLDTEVEDLRGFEREYRSRLKSYFTEQLQALEGSGEGGELPNSGESSSPKRLKSVSDDGPGQQGGNQGNQDANRGNQDANQGGDEPQG
jgi:DivIVA domain-containing protein